MPNLRQHAALLTAPSKAAGGPQAAHAHGALGALPLGVKGAAKLCAVRVQRVKALCGGTIGYCCLAEGHRCWCRWRAQELGEPRQACPQDAGIEEQQAAVVVLYALDIAHEMLAAGGESSMVEERLRQFEELLRPVKDKLLDLLRRVRAQRARATNGDHRGVATGHDPAPHWRRDAYAGRWLAAVRACLPIGGLLLQEEVEAVGIGGGSLGVLQVELHMLQRPLLGRCGQLQHASLLAPTPAAAPRHAGAPRALEDLEAVAAGPAAPD
mmetsp:Transcript_107777/g.300399  ORF Transcript_107777/g.300399 Transcript_107777/m.300399 type:complete len:268 (-) Transcript_107777:252-1055(-)